MTDDERVLHTCDASEIIIASTSDSTSHVHVTNNNSSLTHTQSTR